ncbi:MAG: formate/nitrite transporter family protein, partial [Methylobacterium sp.]
AILMGGHLTVMDYLLWNEIPTLIGNIVGGIAFTGLMLYSTHVRTGATRSPALGAGVRRPIAAE